MRYFRPTSLTWWTGIASVLLGVGLALGLQDAAAGNPQAEVILQLVTQLITAATGSADASPATFILLGLGLIGLGDKVERFKREQSKFFVDLDELADTLEADRTPMDAGFEDADEAYDPNKNLPKGESPFPPDVIDPFGPHGSR